MTKEQKKLFDALTPLQKKVTINVIAGMNNIDAYKAAGGKGKTESAKRASVTTMLANDSVKAFIDAMTQKAVTDAVMSRQEMLERLSDLSRTNMSDLIEWRTTLAEDADGQEIEQSCWAIKESALLNPKQASAIAEVSAGKEGYKIKQHSPLTAMKQLAELAGYIGDGSSNPNEQITRVQIEVVGAS